MSAGNNVLVQRLSLRLASTCTSLDGKLHVTRRDIQDLVEELVSNGFLAQSSKPQRWGAFFKRADFVAYANDQRPDVLDVEVLRFVLRHLGMTDLEATWPAVLREALAIRDVACGVAPRPCAGLSEALWYVLYV